MDSILLEIVRYTVPSLTVFGTIYYLLNKMQKDTLNAKAMDNRAAVKERNDALKIQAFERLILLCERIDPMNLFLRLNTGDISGKHMQEAMLVAINQEYEHNLTQQLYVSPQLWIIITLAKNQMSDIVSQCGDKLYPSDPASKLLGMMDKVKNELKLDPLSYARNAIKNEIDLLIQ
jgi:predicted O-linked N-acetylglucosamine transferase (SPINDLY family)